MKTLKIRGERFLLAMNFFRYLGTFRPVDEWKDAGVLPPPQNRWGFTADTRRLETALAKGTGEASRYGDDFAVDTRGLCAAYDPKLRRAARFVKANLAIIGNAEIDVMPFLRRKRRSAGDDPSRDPAARFLRALSEGTVTERDLMALDTDRDS